MLELRPTCEHCNKALPPASTQAMICSFECTFCSECVQDILHNVCPNCGGGFCPRPIRPARNHRRDNYLGKYPASTQVTYKPIDKIDHSQFSKVLKDLLPEQR